MTSLAIDIAVIAPITHLNDLANRGTIEMALTHLVLDSDRYARHYASRAADRRTVILDNSAYELQHQTGAGMHADAVLTAAQRISATEVICTDVLYNGPATITATRHFLSHAATTPLPKGTRFIGVPQGRTRSEWLACYAALVAMPQITVIGLSKLSVPRCWAGPDGEVADARLDCVRELHHDGLPPKPLHLLGGDRSLAYELRRHRELRHHAVRSNDSSTAVWYAACGLPLDPVTGRAPHQAPTRPDLETAVLTDLQLAVAHRNITVIYDHAGLAIPVLYERTR